MEKEIHGLFAYFLISSVVPLNLYVFSTPSNGNCISGQRIALSWMVNKETGVSCCSGGFLADDQGLGKTISTIALILKERSPTSKASKTNKEQFKTETLNLDDEDGVSEIHQPKQEAKVDGCPTIGGKTYMQAKGRPPAGTLIVCPISVLQQWYDVLRNKVTKEADLSVLLYHGSNRTKDPLELAKYDVVLTTYSIVSMEVPKQPLVSEDEDEIESESTFSTKSPTSPSCLSSMILNALSLIEYNPKPSNLGKGARYSFK